MNNHSAFRRAQVYRLLSDAFIYPTDDWTSDVGAVSEILHELRVPDDASAGFRSLGFASWDLPALQSEYTRAFGVAGSLCYETEYGLPHEFRQSQELADLAGFYRAFGFGIGGQVRERQDHIAVELEFMYALCLKQAYAEETGPAEGVEICQEAQRKFLRDHLARWVGFLAERVGQTAPDGPYRALAELTSAFVRAHAQESGVKIEPQLLAQIAPTPYGPDLSCQDCPATDLLE